MTVQIEPNVEQYACDGNTVQFSFSFKAFEASDIKVVATDGDDVDHELPYGNIYAVVSGSNESFENGGMVAIYEDNGAGPVPYAYPSGWTITISLNVPIDQPVDLLYGGSFNANTIERMVDRVTKIAQQLEADIDTGGGGGGSPVDVSDVPFGPVWSGVTNIAPSQNAVYNKLVSFGSAVDKDYEDVFTASGNLPTGAAIKVYGDANWGQGAVGTSGSPQAGEYARFTDPTTIEGRTAAELRADINVEDGATAYPHAGENAFTDAELVKLNGIEAGATAYPHAGENAFTDTELSKLNGIEDGATAYPHAGENAFTDAYKTKLDGIEDGATADQTASEILTALKTVDGEGSGLDADLIRGNTPGSAAYREAVDTMDGAGNTLPSEAAIKTYGDAHWGGGSATTATYTVLAMGQSNMVGYEGGGGDTATDSRVTAWDDAAGAWVTADLNNPPFPGGHNNIAFHFAKRLAEDRNCNVRIILEAENGRPISDWVPSSAPHYQGMLSQVSNSGTTKIDIILWHQGESDDGRPYADYGADVNSLVSQLRGESFISDTAPFIAGELLAGGPYSDQNVVYADLPSYVTDKFIGVASGRFLEDSADNLRIHFSGESLVVMGRERYHAALNTLTALKSGEKGSDAVYHINASGDTIDFARLPFCPTALSVYLNGDQLIGDDTVTKVLFDTVEYDANGDFSTANARFTAPVSGYYLVEAQLMFVMWNSADLCMAQLHKNGSRTGIEDNRILENSSGYPSPRFTTVMRLNKGDYIEIMAYQYSGTGNGMYIDNNGTGEKKNRLKIQGLRTL